MKKSAGVRMMWRLIAIVTMVSGISCNSGSPPPKAEPAPSTAAPSAAAPAKTPSEPSAVVTNTAEPLPTGTLTDAKVEPTVSEQPAATTKEVVTEEVVPAEAVAVDTAPLDLSKHYRMRAENFKNVNRFAWKIVPHGTQTFANIPLELGGAMFLWGERNAKNGLVYPEQIEGVAVNRAFETLYIYHSAFFTGKPGDVVYDVVFQYEDGTSAKDSIACGVDVLEWYVSNDQSPKEPSGPRSTRAWSGADADGQVVHYCLTAVENPHPKSTVKSLDFVSAKSQTAGCIMGLTVGKSGLLKVAEKEVPPAK
jgi:hypothetical protein